jgi:hypothetical protein
MCLIYTKALDQGEEMEHLCKAIPAILDRAAMPRVLGIYLLLTVGAAACLGADFWEKKPYKEWSQKDCAKMLEDSPWAKTLTLTKVEIMADETAANATMGSGQQPYVKYQAQFRTAAPIRQAIVRQMQLAQKYDSLPPEQKQEFDKKVEGFLSTGSPDAIIVHLTYMANSQTNEMELARHWQSRTTDSLKNSVYLISSKGVRVPLAQYAVAQGGQHEFQFIFPRQYDGKPILSPDDKSLKLEFAYPIVDTMGDGRAFMEFKVQKMTVGGKTEF